MITPRGTSNEVLVKIALVSGPCLENKLKTMGFFGNGKVLVLTLYFTMNDNPSEGVNIRLGTYQGFPGHTGLGPYKTYTVHCN